MGLTRTYLSAAQAPDTQCVRYYKLMAEVERSFRSIKSIDLYVRPIHHRLPKRVRARILLGTLAYFAEWNLR